MDGWTGADGRQMEGKWADKRMRGKREADGWTNGRVDERTGGEGQTDLEQGRRVAGRVDGVWLGFTGG